MSFETPQTLSVRCTLAVVLALSLASAACESEAQREAKAKAVADRQAYQEKYAKAKALFEERCKTAGVVIHRTVKDVEGIELTKMRQPVPWGGKEYFDPMWTEAAMAGEKRGDYYIKQFLMSEFSYANGAQTRGALAPPTQPLQQGMKSSSRGYRFVELLNPHDKSRQRCELVLKSGEHTWENTQLDCRPVEASEARYALDYEDIVDPADRQFWVAGTRLNVIDKRAGKVIATYKKFIWDPGFGASTTGRWPWQHADGRADRNCPSDPNQLTGSDSRYFIDTVLSPKQGD